MKRRTPEQLKGQVRAFAKERELQSQEVLQIFLFERILERLSKSKYSNNFILKGGLLISSMVGISERTTMDMDTTVTGITMNEKEIIDIVCEILSIDVGDDIRFEYKKIESIREDDDYNDYRVYIIAHYGRIANDMKIDITTGDIITPAAVDYSYKTILDGDDIIVKAYNKETIIAEKFETIIRRNIGITRARDFYDLYMFFSLYKNEIDYNVLKKAINRTVIKRGSESELDEWVSIYEDMKKEYELRKVWENYRNNNVYSKNTTFEDVINVVKEIGERIIEV
ncbi:Predicted nucleotidyltransferase component of viral defense system [Eubacterium uniforme]|uniref:Predicted nucleotidyltransferase component of viral defense system n=1 Tax=Eubacterium uniforme TaxID=39495 RepID=A0A1T4W1P0_9FIRM|nr:nucleotidyl transferase AbiEii/AbiGii toxin family protein [Eubacterium uniforme]SKA71180.1 Predicted nucleotidyltransferase component of viral defense system [Eubacterium uniforme]